MDLLIAVGIILAVWVLLSWLFWSHREDFKGYSRLYKGEITTNFNAIPFARNSRKFISKKWRELKPKSGIDKEIAEEEKEIAELEKHKEKMNRLADLKKRKAELFKEVHEGGEWTDEDESYHCYRCDSFIVGLDNFYKHHKEWHK